ncbi:MAG: hypothetical protein GKR87_15905 [Kiritimatiellae bacterium]|nr:hypothetical protein [Kiritimatiellia bacterium]
MAEKESVLLLAGEPKIELRAIFFFYDVADTSHPKHYLRMARFKRQQSANEVAEKSNKLCLLDEQRN